jgi:hypothetical protein
LTAGCCMRSHDSVKTFRALSSCIAFAFDLRRFIPRANQQCRDGGIWLLEMETARISEASTAFVQPLGINRLDWLRCRTWCPRPFTGWRWLHGGRGFLGAQEPSAEHNARWEPTVSPHRPVRTSQRPVCCLGASDDWSGLHAWLSAIPAGPEVSEVPRLGLQHMCWTPGFCAQSRHSSRMTKTHVVAHSGRWAATGVCPQPGGGLCDKAFGHVAYRRRFALRWDRRALLLQGVPSVLLRSRTSVGVTATAGAGTFIIR